MRSHKQVIEDAGGVAAFAETLGQSAIGKVRFWFIRDSIPADYWSAVADNRIATLDELARAASQKRALCT